MCDEIFLKYRLIMVDHQGQGLTVVLKLSGPAPVI